MTPIKRFAMILNKTRKGPDNLHNSFRDLLTSGLEHLCL